MSWVIVFVSYFVPLVILVILLVTQAVQILEALACCRSEDSTGEEKLTCLGW
jgi:hypothetical protein